MIPVVFATDENYARHLAVTLTTLSESNRSENFRVFVIHDGLSEHSLSRLNRMVGDLGNVSLETILFDRASVSHFRLDSHITLASYYRLFLSSLLPQDIDRILYLDCDLAVMQQVRPLFETPLGNRPLAAVENLFSSNSERLGLPNDYVYVNAGVLLVNLAEWRRIDFQTRALAYAEGHWDVLLFHDQDVLNVILGDRTLLLPYRWNFQARTTDEDAFKLGMTKEAFRGLKSSPAIVHYTTSKKPWKYRDDVAFERVYLDALSRTPWAAEGEGAPSPVQRLRRYALRARRFAGRTYRSLRGIKKKDL